MCGRPSKLPKLLEFWNDPCPQYFRFLIYWITEWRRADSSWHRNTASIFFKFSTASFVIQNSFSSRHINATTLNNYANAFHAKKFHFQVVFLSARPVNKNVNPSDIVRCARFGVRVRESNKINCILIRSVRRKKVILITQVCVSISFTSRTIFLFLVGSHLSCDEWAKTAMMKCLGYLSASWMLWKSDWRCEGQPFSCWHGSEREKITRWQLLLSSLTDCWNWCRAPHS